jgi:predicted O-methyltransferase YrrM
MPASRPVLQFNGFQRGDKMAQPLHNIQFWSISLPANAGPGLPNTGSPETFHQNADSWIPEAELGMRLPPYRPTYLFPAFVNERHQALSTCAVEPQGTIDLGVPGWLRREDALKLYELAYFSQGNILELGCFQGLSTSILAQAIRDAGGARSITSIDYIADHTKIARKRLETKGLSGIATFLVGDGADVCQKLVMENRRFSFIFIDHSHRYEDVARVCRLLPDLLDNQGFCLFHDFNDGRNQNPQNPDYGVSQAVAHILDPKVFTFFGIFGCTALFRKCA